MIGLLKTFDQSVQEKLPQLLVKARFKDLESNLRGTVASDDNATKREEDGDQEHRHQGEKQGRGEGEGEESVNGNLE